MSLPQQYEILLQRIDRSTHFGEVQYSAAFHAAGVAQKLSECVATIRSNRSLSPEGQNAEIARNLTGLMSTFVDVTRPMRNAMAQVVGRTLAMKRFDIDKTDFVGELRRGEMRANVKALPAGERLKYLIENIDLPDLGVAILTAPVPRALGLGAEELQHFEAAFLESKFGPQIAEIEAQRKEIETAMMIAKVARNSMAPASGLDEREFEAIASPIEAAA